MLAKPVDYKHLRFVEFEALEKWYVSYYINPHKITSNYNLIKLHVLLNPIKEIIKKDDYKGDFSIVEKISFKAGKIFIRNDKKTGMNLYKLYKDDFLVSKINFHQGAIAINNSEHLLCSTHYQPYCVDYNKVNKDYLVLVLRSKCFLNFLHYLRADGIKNEATFEFIGNLQIPLPPLTTQQQLASAYQHTITQAQQKQNQATQLEQSIDQYLIGELGIEFQEETQPENSEYPYLRFVDLKVLERWDLPFLSSRLNTFKTKYSLVEMNQLIDCILKDEKGFSLKINTSKTCPEHSLAYIGMENVQKDTGIATPKNIFGKAIKSQTARVPRGFFLYGKLRPYLNKYWFNSEIDNAVCSSEFFVYSLLKSVHHEYVGFIVASKLTQLQIKPYYSGARMPRISSDVFKKIQIPLPPLAIQHKIATHITDLKSQIKTLRSAAQQLKTQAKVAFEQAVFNK